MCVHCNSLRCVCPVLFPVVRRMQNEQGRQERPRRLIKSYNVSVSGPESIHSVCVCGRIRTCCSALCRTPVSRCDGGPCGSISLSLWDNPACALPSLTSYFLSCPVYSLDRCVGACVGPVTGISKTISGNPVRWMGICLTLWDHNRVGLVQ